MHLIDSMTILTENITTQNARTKSILNSQSLGKDSFSWNKTNIDANAKLAPVPVLDTLNRRFPSSSGSFFM